MEVRLVSFASSGLRGDCERGKGWGCPLATGSAVWRGGTPLPAVAADGGSITERGTVNLISFGVRMSASDLKSTADLSDLLTILIGTGEEVPDTPVRMPSKSSKANKSSNAENGNAGK